MKLIAPKEILESETRLSLLPMSVQKLCGLGIEVMIPEGFGEKLGIEDAQYKKSGALVVSSEQELYSKGDFAVRINAPGPKDIENLSKGCIHTSFLDPFNNPTLLDDFNQKEVSALSLEMIPRTTLAQKMDFLSSQANLAGYVAVVSAADRLNKIFPMMMTAAGTISPSKVFVIGAGVAGLQAIATAKRLGARVDAFDTRPVVQEQVQSLGAKFIKVDLGETGQTEGGHAKALTDEQIKKQREVMADCCAKADVVITTAQLFGRKAPLIITDEMIQGMNPGSVVVDLAVESGGNVEGSVLGQEVRKHGVLIVGGANYAGKVALHASQMFSSNMVNLIESYWDEKDKQFNLNLEDEILKGCVMTYRGSVVNEMYKKITGGQ